MEPLQEHPHLFANGKFKLCYGKPIGLSLLIFNGRQLIKHQEGTQDLTNMQLVARPISDMTDEEMHKYKQILELGQYHGNPEVWWNSAFEAKLYLLSIGVYPFDQSDFGETVIDSTTL